MRENHKVVGIADIVLGFELVPYILVKLVHIHIDQQLGGQIAEWQALGKAADYFAQKPEDVLVSDVALKDVKECLVVYGGEELADVAL